MSEADKKDYAYKGNINPEYLEWFRMTEDEARAGFSGMMEPPRFCVSRKQLAYLKKIGVVKEDL